jgi:hypothetical protein
MGTLHHPKPIGLRELYDGKTQMWADYMISPQGALPNRFLVASSRYG